MSRNVAKLVNQYLSGRCTHDKYNARQLIINNPNDDVREYGRTARADADKSTNSRTTSREFTNLASDVTYRCAIDEGISDLINYVIKYAENCQTSTIFIFFWFS